VIHIIFSAPSLIEKVDFWIQSLPRPQKKNPAKAPFELVLLACERSLLGGSEKRIKVGVDGALFSKHCVQLEARSRVASSVGCGRRTVCYIKCVLGVC